MRLLKKFNLVLLCVFALGLAATGLMSYRLLHRNARLQIIDNAGLMMETALSTRKYTLKHIKPLIEGQSKKKFLAETVPAFAATQNFSYLQERYPDYSYKEATLNPTNLRDRAVDWETNIISQFRKNPRLTEVMGARNGARGQSLYLAHPIKITDKKCLSCHSTPANAPPSMLAIYGSKNGFGWKHNEVVGAQVISVPMSLPQRVANTAFFALISSIVAIFAVTLIVLNVMLRSIVITPVMRLSHLADEISKGHMDVEELPERGDDEIALLSGSFNRMHRSLREAMRMLDS